MNLLLATRLKNQVKKLNPDIEPKNVKNILINGVKRGCSGFFYNPSTSQYVYINTESLSLYNGKTLIRFAKNETDYRGEINQWSLPCELAENIVKLLDGKTKYI